MEDEQGHEEIGHQLHQGVDLDPMDFVNKMPAQNKQQDGKQLNEYIQKHWSSSI
jgi:hypothetical protein